MTNLVYGWGINDSGYKTGGTKRIRGENRSINDGTGCPYYACWLSMLSRCFSDKVHRRMPAYSDVKCCDEWKFFTKFKEWMESKDWSRKSLDKDILGDGKLYSPETCCFISSRANSFLAGCFSSKKNPYTGAKIQSTGKYASFIKRKNNDVYLGTFNSAIEAHVAWCKAKINAAHELISDENLSPHVGEALINKLSKRLQLAIEIMNMEMAK